MSTRRASARVAAMNKTQVPAPSPNAITSSRASSTKTVSPDLKPQTGKKMPRASSTDVPMRLFPTADDFAAYLADHGTTSPGLLLEIAKVSSPTPSITYASALDTALCYGWIDGQRRSHPTNSQHYFLQRFTPRRKGSLWSKRNVGIVEKLIADGLMKDAGMKEVEKAKADGRWDAAYGGQKDMEVPKDLAEAIAADQQAKEVWEGLPKSRRYASLLKVETAKKAETRLKRIEQIVEQLKSGNI